MKNLTKFPAESRYGIIKYSGCLIYNNFDGTFTWSKTTVTGLVAAKKLIDSAFVELSNNIKKHNS